MKRHLSPDEISNWLIGERTWEHAEHVRECPECSAEIEKIVKPIELFRGAVREWGEEQSSALARHRSEKTIESRSSRAGILWLRAAATAAVLMILIAIGIHGLNRSATETAQQDDALLSEVRSDLSRPVPATMVPLYNLMAEETAR